MGLLIVAEEITRPRGCFYLSTLALLQISAGRMVCVCVCEFTPNSEECLEVKVVGRSNVKFDPANAWPCFGGMSPS